MMSLVLRTILEIVKFKVTVFNLSDFTLFNDKYLVGVARKSVLFTRLHEELLLSMFSLYWSV